MKSYDPELPLGEDSPISVNETLRVMRTGAAFLVVSILQRGAAFLLLPFYSRVLPPAEFGQIAMLMTIGAVAVTLLSFGLETSIFRGYFRYAHEEEKRHLYISSVGSFLVVVPTLTVVLVTALLILPTGGTLGLPRAVLVVQLVASAWFATFSTFPLTLIRAEERVMTFVWANSVFVGVQTIARIIFVLGFRWGVEGWVRAELLAAAAALPLGLYLVRRFASLKWDGASLREALAIGLPLLPHFMSHWVLALSDRLIIGALLGTAAVGIYGMGYTIASIAGLIITEVQRAAMPSYGRLLSKPRDSESASHLATRQLLATIAICFGMAVLGPVAVDLLLDPAYGRSGDVIPVVAAGLAAFGFYYVPMYPVVLVVGKTRWIWLFSSSAAAVNVVLNLLLLEAVGLMAAAINTLVGYSLLLIMVSLYQRRVAPNVIRPQLRRVALAVALAIGTWFALSILVGTQDLAGATIRIAVVIAGAGWLFASEARDLIWVKRRRRSVP